MKKDVFSFRQRVSKDKSNMDMWLGSGEVSISKTWTIITAHLKLSDDRSWRRTVVATNWQSFHRYGGARLLSGL